MKHVISKKQDFTKPSNQLLLCFSCAVLLGAVFGVLTASCLNLTAKQALYSDLTNFVYADHSNSSTYFQALWQIGRIPFAVILFGFTCFGIIGIPAAVFLQGYLISFSVAVMVRLLGWQGLILGISSLGIQALFLLPCLLVLSTQCFRLSKQFFFSLFPIGKHAQNGKIFLPNGFVLAVLLSCSVLFLGAAVDLFFTEKFISFVSNALIIS